MVEAFSRSKAIFSAIAAAMAAGASMQAIFANGMANYSSRGHGRGKYSGKKRGNGSGKYSGKKRGNGSGKNYPAFSTRECERRVRQMSSRS